VDGAAEARGVLDPTVGLGKVADDDTPLRIALELDAAPALVSERLLPDVVPEAKAPALAMILDALLFTGSAAFCRATFESRAEYAEESLSNDVPVDVPGRKEVDATAGLDGIPAVDDAVDSVGRDAEGKPDREAVDVAAV
jgi:hypothetical protein